jgi:hypothetical protein
MDDGAEEEFGPGDTGIIPPGHNAWVVGNEPVVAIDFTGLKNYAKKTGMAGRARKDTDIILDLLLF